MIRRIIWAAVILGAVYFALQAGEYSTLDIMRQGRQERQLQASIDSLQHQVDSLRVIERRVRNDPAMQERIAREEFGMVRGPKEIIYKFAPAPSKDSAAHSAQ
jgi:cell division protein FtsB